MAKRICQKSNVKRLIGNIDQFPNVNYFFHYREMIEAILNMVSPSCRSEMEAAIEEQSDVSNECKIEIQKAVQIISGYNQNQQMQEGEEDQQPSAATNTPPPKNGIHPGYWIALFVVVLVGGVTAYVLHVNKLLEEAFPRKPAKKLSKKKVLCLLNAFSNIL